MQAEIRNPEIADYVAGVLARRIGVLANDPLQDVARGYTHASDFLAVISSVQGKMKFHLQVAAGNQIILTGLFPGFISKRNERCGAPDLEFYESFARRSFQGAANSPHACGSISRKILGELAESFALARQSLNRVAEEFVFLGN